MEPVILTDEQGHIRMLVNMDHIAVVSFEAESCLVRDSVGKEWRIPPDLAGQFRRELAFLDMARVEADEAAILGGQP